VTGIDTNVLVRFLTRDDAEQAQAAEKCIASGAWVSNGVLMETEWVLRSTYLWRPARIADAFELLLTLEPVSAERPADIVWAIARFREGFDWADMLHLRAAQGRGEFATFDRMLAGRAQAMPELKLQVRLLA